MTTWGIKTTISVRISRGDRDLVGEPFEVLGIAYDDWCAHPGIEDYPQGPRTSGLWYAVTHIPSGFAIPHIRPKEMEAIAIAATVAGRLRGSGVVPGGLTVGPAGIDNDHSRTIVESVELIIPSAFVGIRFRFR